MTNELMTVDSAEGYTFPQLVELANMLKSAEGLIPKAYLNKPANILAAFAMGRELGIGPMKSLWSFSIVEGRPSANHDFWIARLKKAGYRVEWLESTDKVATIKLTAKDGSTHTDTWTIDMAKRAGLSGKNNWKSYPEAMLRARATTAAGRAFAAEVMSGAIVPDEEDEVIGASSAHQVSISDAIAGKRGADRLLAKLEASDPELPQATVEPVAESAPPAEVSTADMAREVARRAKLLGWTLEDMAFAQESCGITPPKKLAECSGEELLRLSEHIGNLEAPK